MQNPSPTSSDHKNHTYSVIVPINVYPPPSIHELSAAHIIANFLQSNVICLARTNRKTPDFLINSEYWELKSPTGTGKYNLEHALKSAIRQSRNIIIDARFSKIHPTKIQHQILFHSRVTTKGIKKLLLIDKHGKVIAIIYTLMLQSTHQGHYVVLIRVRQAAP